MNPRNLASRLREAGYHVTTGDVVRARARAPSELVLGRSRLSIRTHTATMPDGVVQLQLCAVAVHCRPPILVCTETGVAHTRHEVPSPAPLQAVQTRLPPDLVAALQRRAGRRQTLAAIIREACECFVATEE